MNFVSKILVIEINKLCLNEGEKHNILNNSILEASLANQYAPYEFNEQAIASAYKSLILNHAFENGNKRTALLVLIYLSMINNLKILLNEDELIDLTLKISKEARGSISTNTLTNKIFGLDLEESLSEMKKIIVEMALSRKDAMTRCISLGEQFIEHFHKIYNNDDNDLRKHWAGEMSGWLKDVKKIILKNTNKQILTGDLRDWFYTAGSNYETLINDADLDEIEKYDNFVTDVINTNDVYLSLRKLNLLKESMMESRMQSAVKSNGVYSVLYNKWIKEPVQADIPDLDQEAFEKMFKEWEDKYFNILNSITNE